MNQLNNLKLFFQNYYIMRKIVIYSILICFSLPLFGQGVTIGSGTHMVVNGDAALVINDGSFTNNGFFASGDGRVYMKGSVPTTDAKIGGTNFFYFNKLIIDKSSNGIQLERNLSIDVFKSIQMDNGDLDLNGKIIGLSFGAAILNESETSRIKGDSGRISILTNHNAPTDVNPGNLGLRMTSSDNLGSFFLHRIHGPQTINGSNSVNRTYKIEYSNTGLTVDYVLEYFDAELNSVNEDYLQTWNYQNTWQQRNVDAANTTSNFVQVNGVSETDSLLALSTGMLQLTPKVLLSGNYEMGGMMNDNLRAVGAIPTSQPFINLGFNLVNIGSDTTTTQTVLDVTGNNAIVDWVLVELRDKSNKDNVLQSVTALLQKDGDIVNVDGISPIRIPNLSKDSFFIAVKHRNHIGVISPNYRELTPLNSDYDFRTDINNSLGGGNGIANLGDGFLALFSGDVDMNGQVQTSDSSALILNIGNSGYYCDDLDLNGQVQNTDLNNKQIPNIGRGVQYNN